MDSEQIEAVTFDDTRALDGLLRFHETGGHSGDGSDANVERVRAVLAKLMAAALTPKPTEAQGGLVECATIAERDNAEMAASMMYRAVTGKEAEWSSDFRLSHAVVEVEARMAALASPDKVRAEALEEAARLIEKRNPNEGGREDAQAIRSLATGGE